MTDRLPPLAMDALDPAQRTAAQALIAGPRKAVIGPFIALLRSPDLMDQMQRVGEYLRFRTALPARLNELAICMAARHVTNQFEWAVHHAYAIREGIAPAVLEAIATGRHPEPRPDDEAVVCALCAELLATNGVSDAVYGRARALLGEQGVIDLVAVLGYFVSVGWIMNVAGTPPPAGATVTPLAAIGR
jgi:4-carboxymuconolactone decarboxylase